MADKKFGVKEINLIGASGTPTIESPDNLNINAVNVAISTDLSVGGASTFTGAIDANGSLDVDGTLNVSGITTIASEITSESEFLVDVVNTSRGGCFRVDSGDDNRPALHVKHTGPSNYFYPQGFDAYRPTQVGSAITNKVIDPAAIFKTDDEVYQYIRSNMGFFDMDQDGVVSPSDVLLLMRELFGFTGNSLTNNLVMGNGTYTNSDYAELNDRGAVMKGAPYTQNVNVGITTTILTGVTTSQVIVGNDYPVGASTFIAANTKVTAIGSNEVTISNATTNTVALTGVAVTFGLGSHGYGMWDVDGSGATTAGGDGLMITRVVGFYDDGTASGSSDPTVGVGTNAFLNPPDYGPPTYVVPRTPKIGIGTIPETTYHESSLTIKTDSENNNALSVTGKVDITGNIIANRNVGIATDNPVVDFQVGSDVIAASTTHLNPIRRNITVITSDGDVGIGLTNPTSNLHVNGTADVSEFVNGVDISSGNLRHENYTYTLTGTITTSTSTGIQTHFGDNVACNGDGSSIMIVGLNTSAQGTISIYDKNGNNYDFVGVVTDTTVKVGYDDDETPADCVMSDDGSIFAFSSGAARAPIGAGNTIVVWQRSGNTLSQLGLIEYDTLTGWGATEGTSSNYSAEFGCSLDMSADGTRFVVGAEKDRLSNVGVDTTTYTGRVHVIDRSGSTFTGIATLTPDPLYQLPNDYFGRNVAMSDDGNTIIVAQPDANLLQGAIYKFSRVGNTVSQVGIATDFGDEDFNEGDYPRRGAAVEISGDGSRIFVGTLSSTSYGNWYYVYVLDSDLNVLEKIRTDVWAGSIGFSYEDRKRLQSSYDGKTIVFGNDFFNQNVIYQYSDLHGKYKLVGSSIQSTSNGCAITRDGKRVFIGDGAIDDAELNYYDINGAEIDVKGKAIISEGVKGSIRQVVGYSTDSTFQTSLTAGHTTINEMGVEINLSSASNKVLVTYDLTGEFSSAGFTYNSGISFARVSGNYASGIVTVTPGNADAGFGNDPGNRNRGITTPVTSYQGTDASSTPEKLSIINFLDSPNTTGIVTYYPTIYIHTGSATWYGNRTLTDTNNNSFERFISYITLQEIVG